MSSVHQASWSPLSGGTDAIVACNAFEGMIETLSRTKESIGRATRHAIDCAKYGIANEVVELLIRKLGSEASLHRRVDLFFLVDSITQCSHSHKGIAKALYIPAIEAALPRIIASAAPPFAGARENHRQCLKVPRLWLERIIMPEFILRRHINEIAATNDDTSSAGLSFRRLSLAERAFDDPIREMEGMLVDEYGSNITFQLPGLTTSNAFDEEEEEDDNLLINLSNEIAETSSQQTPASRVTENHTVTPNERRCIVLEDVDGELEMEDVSNFSEWLPSPAYSPPWPFDTPPETPPLPSSPFPYSQPLHPPLISQHMPQLSNTFAHPQPFPYLPPQLLHEVVSVPVIENQLQRGEAFSQQATFPPLAAVSIPHERAFYESSRAIEYGKVYSCGNFVTLPSWQQYHRNHASNHLSYPNNVSQRLHHPAYPLPNFPYHQEGYLGIPQQRALAIALSNFHPSASEAGSSKPLSKL